MKKLVKAAVLGCVILSSVAFAADDFKIGVVDMQKALQSVDTGKKAKTQLEKEGNDKFKKLQQEQEAINKMVADLKKQAMVLSDEARAKKEAELQERAAKFQQSYQQTQVEIKKRESELVEPIVTKLRGIVEQMAKDKGFSLILEKSENSVIYNRKQDDLTEDLISTYNKKNG